jgi:DNA polymerase V
MSDRTYIAIDLKSFYASVECVARGLDPLTTNLVVADKSRTDKTICLAVSPSMKAYGIGGRARLFEVVQRVKEVNYARLRNAGWHFTGTSTNDIELKAHPEWELDYIVAPPRMAHYIEVSTQVYQTYLKYIAPEDIHVYSIDEVFMDVTAYLGTYKMTPHELAIRMIRDVLATTGITATAGIGTNMYLAKVAMDIVAKHVPADKDGVRIAELDEMTYRRTLWNYRPLTAFWRVGRGIAAKLAEYGITTMGQIARLSLQNEDFFYRLFGVNAELLIDHAWGWEPCTIDYVKAYRPETNSFSSGQVLQEPYECAKAKVVLQEMADAMALSLFSKQLVTDQLVLTINYDTENLKDLERRASYTGPVTTDHYGRAVPKHAHGTENLSRQTSSSSMIVEAAVRLYERITNPDLLIRRITLVTNHVVSESQVKNEIAPAQLDLFTDYEAEAQQRKQEEEALEKERRLQAAQLAIKSRFGKNAILRGVSYTEGATAKDRNAQIGGHRA